LEEARKEKLIGKALEAKVEVGASDEEYELLLSFMENHKGQLEELVNVSELALISLPAESYISEVAVGRSAETKCDRCWRYVSDVSSYGPWPAVCSRCAGALDEMGYSELNASVAQ
jgi:isoleucyl-tRNA synthetase